MEKFNWKCCTFEPDVARRRFQRVQQQKPALGGEQLLRIRRSRKREMDDFVDIHRLHLQNQVVNRSIQFNSIRKSNEFIG